MTGPHEAAELEFSSRGVLRRKTDVRLHHRHLTLLDDEHGDFFDSNQKRVEVISAVQQGIVLEPDLAAQLQELLEVLIRAVPLVLVAQNGLDQSRIRRGCAAGHRLERLDIGESAQAAGDISRGQRLAFAAS